MFNTTYYVTSTVSIRCKGGHLSFSFNENHPCFLNDTCVYKFPISFPPLSSCCGCCANTCYSYGVVPLKNPTLLCGLRQSKLIQWSSGRRLVFDGASLCYSRLSSSEENTKCSYAEASFRGRGVVGRRGKWGKMGRYGCNVDEADAILSLLAEEEVAQGLGVRERNGGGGRNDRRVQLEKRVNSGNDFAYKSKKKNAESCDIERTLKRTNEFIKLQHSEEDRRRDEDRRDEKREMISRGESSKARSEGSSCSSYYSLSSSGEFESDSKIQAKLEGYKRDYPESKYDEEVDRHKSYVEEQNVSLKNEKNEKSAKELHSVSIGIDYDLRKKSEKKLTKKLAHQTESWKESSENHSRLSDVHESGYKKSSNAQEQYDERKEQLGVAVNVDDTIRLQRRQALQQVNEQPESRIKYKQFTGMADDSAFETTSSSQKHYRGSEDKLLGSSNFIRETERERPKNDATFNREEKHWMNSQKFAKSLKLREINDRETSISHGLSETKMKNSKDEATMVLRSPGDSAEQQHREDHQGTTPMGSSGGSQLRMDISNTQTINNQTTFISQRKSEIMSFHEDMSEEAPASPSMLKLHLPHHVGSSRDTNTNTRSNATVRTEFHGEPISVLRTSNYPSGSSALPVHALEGSSVLENKIYGIVGSEAHGDTVTFVSHEDAIDSAARLQKSSMHFVDEFVDKVKHEASTSEVLRETRTYTTKLVNEGDPHEQKGLDRNSSGDSEKKDHGSTHSSQGPGRKGPSDEMWDVTDQSIRESLKTEISEGTSATGSAVVKRNARSLWSIISDIVRLRWDSRSESGNSRSGRKHSPNQSTSSEVWFSGHEHDENNEEHIKHGSEKSSIDLKQIGEIHAQSQGEASNSKSSEDEIKDADLGPLSPLKSESDPAGKAILTATFEEATAEQYEGTGSGTVIAESLGPFPTIRMRRSHPIVQEISEGSKAETSDGSAVVTTGEPKQMKFQRSKQVLKDRFDEWEEAYTIETTQRKHDEMFMREALLEAKKAGDVWEVPVGAVLVQNGKIIARGYNLVEELRDSTAHAEMICIREASKVLRSWRLSDTTLYVTLEPCPMCAGAILQARVDTIVWGAPNKLLGADGSWIRLFPSGGEGQSGSESTDKPAAPVHPFHPNVKIRRGILASECADVMQQFFQFRRRKKEKKQDPPPPPPPASPPSCLPISTHPSKFLNKMHHAFNIMFCL